MANERRPGEDAYVAVGDVFCACATLESASGRIPTFLRFPLTIRRKKGII